MVSSAMRLPVSAAEQGGTILFQTKCVGCHAGGGNVVVRGGKSLSRPDLEANGVYSRAAVADIVGLGQGAMPGFGETCTPKGKCTFGPRLTESEIAAVSLYVIDEAEADWGDTAGDQR